MSGSDGSHRAVFFPARTVATLTDGELLAAWFECPPCDELDPWFQAVIDEMERRRIIF